MRMELGLSQDEFSLMLNMGRSKLAMIEKGERKLGPSERHAFDTLCKVIEKDGLKKSASCQPKVSNAFLNEFNHQYKEALSMKAILEFKIAETTKELTQLSNSIGLLNRLSQNPAIDAESDWKNAIVNAFHSQSQNFEGLLQRRLKSEIKWAKANAMILIYESYLIGQEEGVPGSVKK